MPGSLVLTLNQSVLGDFSLDKERLLIGRKPENDIQVDNLAVSGQHAAIITILNDSFLEDLDSTNGTFVNGKLVKKHALKHGDVITIGKHELKYVNDEATTDDQDFEKTMIIRPGMASHAAAAAKAEQTAPPTPAGVSSQMADTEMPLGKIQVLSGPGAGKELELKKVLITLGRPGVQVAVITRRPHGYFITHVEGKHPLVNGDTIGAQAHALKDHDVVELAGVKMEFFVSA
jgi:pSer/pThr/pTyr-binding forkhead associated (FHA) protein